MTASLDKDTPTGLIGSFSEVRPRRSVAFFAAGGLVGLALAGYGLFTAQGTTTHSVPPEDIALVNQRPILRSDYIAQLDQVYGVTLAEATQEQRERFLLQDMIREELFVQRGLELDMPSSDPDTRNALVAAVEQQVVIDVTTQKPTDEILRVYYQQHQADYATLGSMAVRDLVLATADRAVAVKAVQALRGGTPPDTVVANYGLKESGKVAGEEFYFAAKIHLGDSLFAAAAALRDHDISDPVGAPDGLHILIMGKNVAPVPQSFDQARERILNDYRAAETARLTGLENKFLQDHAEILITRDFQ